MIIKEFFYLPKSDRRAIMTILVLLLFVIIAYTALSNVGTESNPIDTTDSEKSEGRATNSAQQAPKGENFSARKVETFYFDPNTADSTQLLRLGLQHWQVRNIYKYRAKGGIYRCKEDFAFVYGLTVKDYRRLAPYIRISEEYMPASSLAEVRQRNRYNNYGKQGFATQNEGNKENSNSISTENKPYTPKIHKGEYISVNSSDTTTLMRIPGIGSYYARQTIRYREMLGGFVDKRQLLEIENFPAEALEYISIDNNEIKKLNVNKLSLSQLRRHPYINYYQAAQ